MSKPALSVILPNYNHAAFLDRAITAFLDQSFRDFELIIVDDASTDHSVEVIEKYARADPRVTLHRNPENKGVIFTLNRLLGLARADHVMGAASDDYILPGYFAAAMDMFARYPQAGICLGLCASVNEDGDLMHETPGYWSSEPEYISPDELVGRVGACGVPGPVVWHRQGFLDAGGYIPELRWHGDWFTLQVLAFRRGVCFLPYRTSVVRNATDSYSAGQRRFLEQREVLRHLLALVADPRYADVRPHFTESTILTQFGAELVRVAVTEPDLPAVLLPVLKKYVFGLAKTLLRDPTTAVAVGTADLLVRYGRDAVPMLEELARTPTVRRPQLAAAVDRAGRAIRRTRSYPSRMLRSLRNGVGAFMRGLDRFLHPLHHRRLESIDLTLQEMHHNATNVQPTLSQISRQIDDLRGVIAPPDIADGRAKREA